MKDAKEKAIEYLESLENESEWKDTLLPNHKETTKKMSLAIDIAIAETKQELLDRIEEEISKSAFINHLNELQQGEIQEIINKLRKEAGDET